MLIRYQLDKQRHLIPSQGEITSDSLAAAMWLDLVNPDDDERNLIESLHSQPLPDTEDVEEIEASARSYQDEAGLHVHSLFLHKSDERHRNTSVAFTLTDTQLITLREREIPAFRLMRMRGRRLRGLAEDPVAILLSLFEIKIDDLADTLEEVYTQLEETSNLVLEDNDTDIEDALDELARQEDTNGKVRLCLMDTQRALSFLLRRGKLSAVHAETARELLRDIDSLLPHNSFVFDKINFLMDAAQGFISIQQNQIIKTFSIAAVVFLPPTVIASIYGMNFDFIPELEWSMGYPWALGLMVLSGVAPYVFFKLKGWL
ncbi:magnesium/cobalt transporter CorA [Pseudohongiella sp. SYSU M77423]|uniref:magnesium/cobalt transporter CorA n=1 Tax=unclassified Pseudohongiella TaxID=2629611 RepID=UPI000C4385D6|nr:MULTISPECIES: magnesium/cobalt transporter CorA [unclassified Pseudohongiella]MAY57034.1 magnesium and cobalt transport protein CorA [Gammaproteobacteria bacterium]MBJ55118.1 magnesium and cobalt transport protein CorA [Gammaproteobacteria bacterium]MDH7943308.1 magnesium/cobalt transporter CorA [Pseudohongiella sp. SYSU M77423]|tara:strand:+ start:2078 stop:3028 length:951 start_codon:yes stop_codon:yes gene_type:complete